MFYSHSLLSFTSECFHNYSSFFVLSFSKLHVFYPFHYILQSLLPSLFHFFPCLTMFSFMYLLFFPLLLSFLSFNLISIFSLFLYFCFHICYFLCLRLYLFNFLFCSFFPLFSPDNRLTTGFFEGLRTYTYAGNVSLTEII